MKALQNILSIVLAALIVSCSNIGAGTESASAPTNGKKKFAPKERVSSLTDSEREAAIAAKKAGLEGLSIDTLLNNRGITFSIVQPNLQGEDITQDISDRIAMKLLQIACQNGISGLGINPTFVFGTEIMQTGRAVTGTAPQKMTVQYELTFKVLNVVTGDVYATATQSVIGVGNSFVEANQNFVREIKNSNEVQKMLQTASNRIIDWYNNNVNTLKNQIETAAGKSEYELALALAMSVPEQATEAFEYASGRLEDLTQKVMHKRATDLLGEMTSVISTAGDDFDPAVGAYFKLIPVDAPEYAKAQTLYDNYIAKCNARRKVLEEKAERDEKAARELEQLKMKYAHETELAELETRKITAKYEADVAARTAEANARVSIAEANARGKIGAAQAKAEGKKYSLFGSIGYGISGTFERIFKAVDNNL